MKLTQRGEIVLACLRILVLLIAMAFVGGIEQ